MMSDVFIDELRVPEPDHTLGVGSGSHAVQTARVMERLEPLLEREPPDLLIVPGDVNSTMAASLVAVKLGIPLAHVESGLRSFDRTMPEEINRIVTDQFSDHLFIHSEDAIENLRREGIGDDRMHFVGNTMIDSLVATQERFRSRRAAEGFGLSAGDYVLVTLHRPNLVDGPLLSDVVAELEQVAKDVPSSFPCIRAHGRGLENTHRILRSSSPTRWATSTSSRSRQTPPRCSRTPAECRRRRPSSACRASRSATRQSVPSRSPTGRTRCSGCGPSASARYRSCSTPTGVKNEERQASRRCGTGAPGSGSPT